ncbi:hypothetical protein AB4Z01_07035 [Inquilinus sp. YAF38]
MAARLSVSVVPAFFFGLVATGIVRLALRRKLVAKAVVIPFGRVKPTSLA